jgi:hypothetical protein
MVCLTDTYWFRESLLAIAMKQRKNVYMSNRGNCNGPLKTFFQDTVNFGTVQKSRYLQFQMTSPKPAETQDRVL